MTDVVEWIVAAVVTGAVVAVAAWASRRGWIDLRTKRGPRGGSGALGELIEAFQPSYSYYQEEKERHRVVADRDAPPPPEGIDPPRSVDARDDEDADDRGR